MNPEKEEKENTFVSWLRDSQEYALSANKITSSLNFLSALYLKAGVMSVPILKMDSEEQIIHVLDILHRNKMPRIHSKKQLQGYLFAVNVFLEYLRNRNKAKDDSEDNKFQADADHEDIMYVDFTHPSGFAYTRPNYYQFDGEKIVPVKNWTKLYVGVVNDLCRKSSTLLESLVGKNISGATRVDVLRAQDSHLMTAPFLLENGLAIETNLSASDVVKKIRTLLSLYQIDYDSLKVAYHKREAGSDPKPQNHQINTWKAQYTDNIVRLLEDHYSYGFRIGSPIEMMRFRNYAESDAVMIPYSDEELQKEICAAGTLIDGKVFIFDKAVLEEVANILNTIFSAGITAVFLKSFMEKNSDWMEHHHIVSEDMLKELLKRGCTDYYFGQNIITQGEKKTEYEVVVSEIHRVSGDNKVIWFFDLCEKLEYIPTDKIAWNLSISDDFIWISEGRYFVMNHFVIDEEESAAIRNFVSSECVEKGYASISDVPLGSIAEQNYELSANALYSAIYNAVLKQDYHLNGKILTREKSNVDIIVLLKNYCKGRSVCKVAEVMGKAKELIGVPNRQNAFAALYDTMIRVDKDKFVSEKQISFDVERIDNLLRDIVGNRFAPIKSVTTFVLFPPCGYSWNHYLLESFCYRFSSRYQLCVLNYNDKNAGIIASKALLLSYNDMLCEMAADADVDLTIEAVGQYFFENGLTAKRKYACFPEIIERANTIREGR